MAEPTQQQDVLPWLKTLPSAPEFHPTLAEFQDPIAYIFKIEQEASQYGICKIVPPVPPAPKKTAITNLNRSLAQRAAATASGSASNSSSGPTFTTRQQQIGFCPRKPRPVQKPVWQSGEYYTFQEFENKAKNFEKSYLKKCGSKKTPLSALEIESLYWKATVDKPFSVEYANDMPGSAFTPVRKNREVVGEGVTLGETAWNMRRVSRAKGSLLRFMKEEIPGVTSPMVYIAMMFSWFAWHAEDHDLHSLNYLHMGASKTWYGVPMAAANAFEEVVRVHGYGGEINPLVTFSTLGEKTTMMSPQVFVGAGVPCCRLVQNAGEYVVTFPRAYHMGFSHGFNCGEAANIATPEWLNIAKDAAIRRASINYPPMVSHFQLLYDLAIALHSRVPMDISVKPRSSRLQDKKKDEGETLVKKLFVQDVVQNNELLHILGNGSSIVLLPQSYSGILGVNTRTALGLCSYKESIKSFGGLVSDDILQGRNNGIKPVKGFYSMKGNFSSLCERNSLNGTDNICTWTSQILPTDNGREGSIQGDWLSDKRLFSCATCGILSFACVAVIQPREPTARYLMSADCSFFNDWIVGSGVTSDGFHVAGRDAISLNSFPRLTRKSDPHSLYDVPVQSIGRVQSADQSNAMVLGTETKGDASALALLALTYSSDSDEGQAEPNVSVCSDETNLTRCSSEKKYQPDFHGDATGSHSLSLERFDCRDEPPLKIIDFHEEPGFKKVNFKDRSPQSSDYVEFETENLDFSKSNGLDPLGDTMTVSQASNSSQVVLGAKNMEFSEAIVPVKNADMSLTPRSDEDSSRMHVFCLEHAMEVEQQLRLIGGVNILLLCHPEYPKIVAEAKLVAEELGMDSLWNDISFRNATKDDEDRIHLALDSEDARPGNGDWAVKLGINLFYSASLSHSSLYSKQMPYNSVIYNAFGRSSPASSPTKCNHGRRYARQKKVVAGKWCGRVWMSNHVHPFLAQKDSDEQEQEQEEEKERSFHGWATESRVDQNLERKSETTCPTEFTSVTRKFSNKRKMAAESRSMKVKCFDAKDAGSDDSLEDGTRLWQSRILRRKPTYTMEGEDVSSYDSPEDDSHRQERSVFRRKQVKTADRVRVSNDLLKNNILKQYRRIPRSKQAKCVAREDAVSDDLPDDCSLKQYRRIPRNKPANYIKRGDVLSDNSLADVSHKQQHNKITRSKQARRIERDGAVSDVSLEDVSHKLKRKRILKSKQAKYIGSEDAVSDYSLEDNSLQLQHKRLPKSKQTKCMEREDAGSDYSLEDDSCKLQHKRIPKSKQTKCMERENAGSDDSLEDNSLQLQHKRIPKSKQTKCMEREDAGSDDSLEDDSCQLQHKRIPKRKQTKCMKREDAGSDDSLEDNSRQLHRRIPKGKPTKWIARQAAVSGNSLEDNSCHLYGRIPKSKFTKWINEEDVVSDDSLENNFYQQRRKISRVKQAKCTEMEDAVSYDSVEDDAQLLRRIPKSKKTKFVDREDAVSFESLEDDSHRVHGRILRSKQVKTEPPQKIKPETPWHMKPGKQCLSKQETPQQMKQGTRCNNKTEQNARQLDSSVEEEIEGGPSTRLRKRNPKPLKEVAPKSKHKKQTTKKKLRNASAVKAASGFSNAKVKDEVAEYQCDMDGCTMSFGTKHELALHKRNICPVKGCGKTFFSHKYLVQHRRVHVDDRPLKCPWKGCKMTFKWAWARTEHVRVHTGERPYVCGEAGCGQTFRFVSDFSRHKRKTGHSTKKTRG